LRRRGDAITAFNPRDRCWFLDDGGLCRVEAELGRARKPASCRLFPFNRVFRLGGFSVVDYNSVICPLQIGGAAPIHHRDVIAEIDGIADPAVIGTPLPATDPDAEGRALVTRERAIADACFAAAAAGDVDAGWAAHGAGALDAARGAVGDAARAITGLAWAPPSGATLANALWLTPSLRFNELYGPRQYAPRAAMIGVLPAMWLAWLGFAALGAELAGRDLGLQELTTIWSEQAPLAYAAARWTDVPTLKPGPIELPGSGDPRGVVRRIAQACIDNRRARRPLGELVSPLLAAVPATDRVALVKQAEPVLRASFQRT
jgi:hypothetical protein